MDLTGNTVSNMVSLTLDSVFLSHLHLLSWHPGSSDHKASPESSCMATDRSITTMSCVFIGSQCFHPHPPPPRQVLVILLKCASEHQSSTPRLSISLRLQVLSRAHARDIFLLFTWPTSTHLSMSFSEEGFPVPLIRFYVLCSLKVHWHVLTHPYHLLTARRHSVLWSQSIMLLGGGDRGWAAGWQGGKPWGEWAAEQMDKVRANSN